MTPSVIVANARHLDRVPAGYSRIYVGRSTSYKPEYGADFSVLGNPFGPRGGDSRDEAVEAFEARVEQGLPLVPRRALDVLRERARTEQLALVCFCHPQRCHADVIKKELEGGQR